jgi:4-carboxymuconolactone decarboxylase
LRHSLDPAFSKLMGRPLHSDIKDLAFAEARSKVDCLIAILYDNLPFSENPMTDKHADDSLPAMFERGLKVRREVLGADYVDKSIASANDFMMAFQQVTTEWCWGYAWSRPGLDRKTRSLLNLAMLTALNRSAEVRLHVKGAINNGVTVDEIKEVLLQATIYCGIPAGLDAFKAANEVLQQMNVVPAGPSRATEDAK